MGAVNGAELEEHAELIDVARHPAGAERVGDIAGREVGGGGDGSQELKLPRRELLEEQRLGAGPIGNTSSSSGSTRSISVK
ncbi:MAG: hypothetical protein JNJ54_30325 [Myxococcaceae bacterium]|nr:hypothetical protein [Myxococcaceae bacterium]